MDRRTFLGRLTGLLGLLAGARLLSVATRETASEWNGPWNEDAEPMQVFQIGQAPGAWEHIPIDPAMLIRWSTTSSKVARIIVV